MKSYFIVSKRLFMVVILLVVPLHALAGTPFLAFSDLISGPDTGLGDGMGSGAIVTVWGTNLGKEGDLSLIFRDSAGKKHKPYIYYWKEANGQLPSGPANLHASHGMQEIAFSVPSSAPGNAEIQVKSGTSVSNVLPFLVRPGKIFHVKSSGSDSNDGSWAAPWKSLAKVTNSAPAGSTTYIHDVDTGSYESPPYRAIYWNNANASSGLDAQFAISSYPGNHPKVVGQQGVINYNVEGMVVAKLDIYASNYLDVDEHGQPIGSTINSGFPTFGLMTDKNGRGVANRIGDIPGGCASYMQGAIFGDARYADNVSNYKALGNEIYDYGCHGSNRLHHTTYLSIRSAPKNTQVEPWEWGFNYLHGNKAVFGIHQFDQDEGCGDLIAPLEIHNNVVKDQGGAGISIASSCGWSMDAKVYNNLLIDTGLASAWDGVDVNTSHEGNGGIAIWDSGLLGTMYIFNNTIYGPTSDGQGGGGRGCLSLNGSSDNVSIVWNNNICYLTDDLPFIGAGYRGENKLDNVSGTNNIWFSSSESRSNLALPEWDPNPMAFDPLITISGSRMYLQENSPAIDQASPPAASLKGVYGTRRLLEPDIGAVEYARPGPLPPTNLTVD